MKTALITTNYNELAVSFTEDGWFNATEVAAKFGKRPTDWLRLPDTERYIDALCRKSDVRKSHFTLTRKGNSKQFTQGTWLHPKLGVRFAQWLDIEFAVWCDDEIYKILSGSHTIHDWKKLRHEAASSYKVMQQITQYTREKLGKTTAKHHYTNEARLINWALVGKFGKVDRDGLSVGDLDLLAKLENMNTVLIGCGVDYGNRKTELEQFAKSQRCDVVSIHRPDRPALQNLRA